MGFLDNLENDLKNLESSQEGREEAERAQRARESERARTLAAAPFADKLRNGPFTAELFKQAARVGFSLRTKIHIAWLGTTLRLEAGNKRLELRPTADGVVAVSLVDGAEVKSEPCPLEVNPEELVRNWLA
jgi:hypothetical protein